MTTERTLDEPVMCGFCGAVIAPEDIELPEVDPADITSIPQYQEVVKKSFEFGGADLHVCPHCRRGIDENDAMLETHHRRQEIAEGWYKGAVLAIGFAVVAVIAVVTVSSMISWLLGWR